MPFAGVQWLVQAQAVFQELGDEMGEEEAKKVLSHIYTAVP